jgi:hypothetical protein
VIHTPSIIQTHTSSRIFHYKYLPSPTYFLIAPLFIHYKIKILSLPSYYQASSLKKSLVISSSPAASNLEPLRVSNKPHALSTMHPKRNEDPKVKKPDSLRVPGNNRWAEFIIPTKGKQAVREGVAGSLYVVGGAVYDDVENISGDGKGARGTGSRG